MVSLFKQTLEKPLTPSQASPVSPTIADSYDKAFIHSNYSPTPFIPLFFVLAIGSIIALQATNLYLRLAIIGGMVFFVLRYIFKTLIVNPKKRIDFIINTPIPAQLWHNENLKDLNLPLTQRRQVEAGLKDFFILHALYPNKPLAMPSQLVDKLWHAFILDTKSYQDYCKNAFGKLFHHIPDYQFRDKNHNIQMFTWQSACRLQGLTPANPPSVCHRPATGDRFGGGWGNVATAP